MGARQPSVKLTQKWDHTERTGSGSREVYSYVVKQTKNTTQPRIHERLTEEQVNLLIQTGYDVTIDPIK